MYSSSGLSTDVLFLIKLIQTHYCYHHHRHRDHHHGELVVIVAIKVAAAADKTNDQWCHLPAWR